MTVVGHAITESDVRRSVSTAQTHLEKAAEEIVWQIQNRAWSTLGYDSWDAMREAEYGGAAVIVPRADRPQIVARLRSEGMSQQSISDTIGVGQKTVSRDLASQMTKADAAVFIERYPALDHYADNPKRVIATGTQLDTFSPTELPGRLDNLSKHIAAEKRTAENPMPKVPDYYVMTDAMFDAANALCQAIDKQGGADTLTAALADANPADAQLWADQFASAVTKLSALTNVTRPTIRRVK